MQTATLSQKDDLARIWRAAHADLREVIERLAKFLTEHLDVPVYTRRKFSLFAWRRLILSTDDQWKKYQLYFFGVGLYNEFTYRLSISACNKDCLPKRLTDRAFADPDRIELSFVAADLEKFISPDLPKFVESVFDGGSKDVHPWPLFASDRNFPTYAWSIAGEAEYQHRREGTYMRRERREIK